jgi:hypothetical protein
MPSYIQAWLEGWWFAAPVLVAVIVVMLMQRQLARVIEANRRFAPPEDRQVRWHIRHLRQDLALVAYLLMGILTALIVIAGRLPVRS